MVIADAFDLISISAAEKRGISRLVDAVEAGHEQVLLRNNTPVAAIIGVERFHALQCLEEDLIDMAVATVRLVTTSATRHTLDEVLAYFNYTRDDLRDLG